MPKLKPTSTHWGHYQVATENGKLSAVLPNKFETNPSPIAQSMLDAQHSGCRVPAPHIGSSELAQGTSAHSTLVEAELFEGELPPVKVFDQPPTAKRP